MLGEPDCVGVWVAEGVEVTLGVRDPVWVSDGVPDDVRLGVRVKVCVMLELCVADRVLLCVWLQDGDAPWEGVKL